MAIERMLKLRLMAMKSQEEALLQRLQLLGCVQVNPPDSVLEDASLSELVATDPGELAQLRDCYARLQDGIALLDRYAPAKKKLTAPRPLVQTETLLDEDKLTDAVGADPAACGIFYAVDAAAYLRIDGGELEGKGGVDKFAVPYHKVFHIAESLKALDSAVYERYIFGIPAQIFAGNV